MVESLYSVVPSIPSLSADAQSWIVAAIVFAMAFLPIWRFGKSLCDGIDRINARKAAKPLGRAIGYQNKPGVN